MKKDGHRQCHDLAFRNGIVADPVDKKADLIVTQRLTITLFANNFLSEKHYNP